jgi:hypothetical protein
VHWLTATVEFVVRLKKLWKPVATRLSTATVMVARKAVLTAHAVITTLLRSKLLLLPLLKLLRLRLLRLNLRLSSRPVCTISRRAGAGWLACSE